MIISRTNKLTDQKHIVLIGDKTSDFGKFLSGPEERKYIKACLDNKDREIFLNQYKRWIFIAVLEKQGEDEPPHKINEKARIAARKIHSAITGRKLEDITLVNAGIGEKAVVAFAEGLALSNYQFLKYKTDQKKHSLNRIFIYGSGKNEIPGLNFTVEAVYRARDLVNEPLSYLTAVKLSQEFRSMGKTAGFHVEVFNRKKIESLGMGGLLAVNKGSIDPPTFSILTWKPSNPVNKDPLVLVGKGVVYDTGGLSLKPTHDSMDYMKSDMAGAATVASALFALARMKIPVYVIGLVPATDNRPDGNACTPGDVVKMHDGSTVEVLNTDAEGRMILADALSWAKQYNPELVISISTLTGAAYYAVGKYGIVAMQNEKAKYFYALKKSGEIVYERIAEFPFWDEYNELLKSDIADLKNIGGKIAGAITAGKFLEHFTPYPFIHLDIAGPAFNKTDDHYRLKGGTGIGVRLLIDFMKTRASKT